MVVATAIVLAVASVAAQTADQQAEAQRLFEQGVAAAAAGDYANAVFAFSRSYQLYPHPGTLKNLAVYQDQSARLAEAYGSWQELVERYRDTVSDATLQEARQRIADLEAILARVEVTADVAGAILYADGRELGPSPLAEPLLLEAGPHVFEARLEGHEPARTSRQLVERANPRIELHLEPIVVAPSVLRVESRTPGGTASIDGGQAESVPLLREIEPGVHAVRLEAQGYLGETREVSVPVSGEVVAAFDLAPIALPPPVEPPSEESEGFWEGPWPWVIGGLLVLGAGATTAVLLWPGDEPSSGLVVTFR